MMPPIHQLLMPAALVLGAGYLSHKGILREYPAFFAWAMLLALFTGMVWGDGRYPVWITVAGAALVPFQVRESLIHSRIPVTRGRFLRVVLGAALASCTVALLIPQVSGMARWNMARSCWLLAGMVAMWASVAYRLRHPVLEHVRDQVYRYGVAAWLLVKAPASTFARGGFGKRLFPHADPEVVQQWCYWLLIACAVGMVTGMARATMKRRKVAAKTGDVWLQEKARKAA